jgi:hypothetical protein
MMRGRLPFAVAIILTAAAGVASASALRVGPYVRPPPDPAEPLNAPPGQIGEPVPDPGGGPPWAVRVTPTPTGNRCITVGRTDGSAFGPVDAAGDIVDTGPSFSGSCAPPGAEPVQVAVARYPGGEAGGARTVLFGFAEAAVTSVAVTRSGTLELIAPDRHHTLLLVQPGMSETDRWTVTVTLTDGAEFLYIL